MHRSVQEAWPRVAAEHEGRLDWLYLDTKNLVTTGIGFLMDEGDGRPPQRCLTLPWIDGGQLASQVQIITAWNRVKARTDLAQRGGYAFRDVTTLRLSGHAIDALLTAKTLEFWSALAAQLPGLEQWPADAQLALIDMAWQLGPNFLGSKWPNFTAAAHSDDFIRCSQHCSVKQASIERNGHRIRLFQNAAQVVFLNIDPAELWDDRIPEEDEMLTDAQIKQIAEKLNDVMVPDVTAAVVAELKRQGLVATPASVAKAVLDSSASDVVPVGGTRKKLWVKTALAEIHKAVGAKPL